MLDTERNQVLPDPVTLARRLAGQARTVETELRAKLAYQRALIKGQPAFRDSDYVTGAHEDLKARTRAAIRLRKRWDAALKLLEGEANDNPAD